MTTNIMQQYIKQTKSFLTDFTKLYMGQYYDEKISNELINAYIEARIYNYGDGDYTFFYKRIEDYLESKKEKIEKDMKGKDLEPLENNLNMYQFVFYADGVRPINDLKEFLAGLCEKRIGEYNLDPQRNLASKLEKKIKEYTEYKEKYITSFDTADFIMDVQKYINIDDTYKADLNYSFKLPYIYSEQIIDEVYNEGTINEDKLIILYTLLVARCIKDVNHGDFDTKYLVQFARTLFSKDKKRKQTLRLIDDPIIQEKINLKILYSDFVENKDLIYSLIQDGYRFAIVIDDTFEVNDTNLRKLNIFKYMMVPKECKNYEKISSKEAKINNTIIYDL
ncbi:MAG: hypothetical protein IKP28_05635 [Clostridia bacterium]|nr:hypothetical protein [Clostridia bacterium]